MTLNRIAWTFTKDYYTDAEKFNQEVAQYQKDLYQDESRWHPNEIVFNVPELQIQQESWIAGTSNLLKNETIIDQDQDILEEELYQVEVTALIKADNGASFTALAFLMKAHNQQANKELGDHVFFEGTDENPEIINGVPTCFIACRS